MWWLTEGGRQGFQVRERNHPNTCNFVPSSRGKGRGLVLQVEQSNDNDSGKINQNPTPTKYLPYLAHSELWC